MLSSRAQIAVATPANPLWSVLNDQYCPRDNPNGYVNLGVAENTLMYNELVTQLKQKFNPPQSAFSYGSGPGGSLRLRSALAEVFNRYFSPHYPVEPSHINVSNGVTASMERCAFTLGDPGDIFLLGRPYYGSYPSDIGDRAGIKTLSVSFGSVDPMSVDAVRCYEQALLSAKTDPLGGGNVRGLILCSPHNPLGQCYSQEALQAICRLCQQYKIHLICDEIYALSVFRNPTALDATQFSSILSIDKTDIIDPALVHVLWGLSKDFGANGMRIGCVVSQHNPQLINALDTHGAYSYPSAMLEYMACCILEDKPFLDFYVHESRKRLRENYLLVTKFLSAYHIPYRTTTNAGMFVWANIGAVYKPKKITSPISEEISALVGCGSQLSDKWVFVGPMNGLVGSVDDAIQQTLIAHKVFLASGKAFGSEKEGWVRVVFSQDSCNLYAGLVRLVQALELSCNHTVDSRL